MHYTESVYINIKNMFHVFLMANAYGVIKAAKQLGFTAKGVKGDKEAFFLEFPLPCIAHVIVDGALLHYVVVHKDIKETSMGLILL